MPQLPLHADEPIMIHLRGTQKTACGLNMWVTNGWDTVTAVDSIGHHFDPDHPVTCLDCLQAIALANAIYTG